MQLSGLIEKLQGLFTRATLVANLVPTVFFFVINVAILGRYDKRVDTWIHSYASGDGLQKTLTGLLVGFALLVIAYVYSSLNLVLRQVLEGKYLPTLLSPLTESEYRRRHDLKRRFDEAAKNKFAIEGDREKWARRMQTARNVAKSPAHCTYSAKSRPAEVGSVVMRNRAVKYEEFEQAVTALERVLQSNSADLADPDSKRLDADQWLLLDAIDESIRRYDEAMLNAYNEQEFDFSRYALAPTRMGNIAESARSYARSRYEMNLDFLWTRFQRVLQGPNGTAYYQTLQDAKTQVDFAVSMFWLIVGTTTVWLVLLPYFAASFKPVIALAVVGSVLARAMYLVAVQNYRSFSDLLRSCIDLFRMEVLAGFNIDRPQHSKAERQIWRTLSQSLAYGEDELICFKKE